MERRSDGCWIIQRGSGDGPLACPRRSKQGVLEPMIVDVDGDGAVGLRTRR